MNSSLHYSMRLIPRIHQFSGTDREPMYIISSLSNSQGGTELKWLSHFAKATSLPNAQPVLQHTAVKRKLLHYYGFNCEFSGNKTAYCFSSLLIIGAIWAVWAKKFQSYFVWSSYVYSPCTKHHMYIKFFSPQNYGLVKLWAAANNILKQVMSIEIFSRLLSCSGQ